MLRVVIQQLPDAVRLELHGTLGGDWVPLVERHWRSLVNRSGNGRHPSPQITIALSDVDFIDADGARLLERMAERGADFIASGCMNRHVVEMLQSKLAAPEGVRTMATRTTAPEVDLRGYEDKIAATIHEANARIDQFEATARAKRAQAEIAAIDALKTTREKIEHKLNDLHTTQAAHVARVKSEIDASVVKLEKALEDFRQKYTTPSDTGR